MSETYSATLAQCDATMPDMSPYDPEPMMTLLGEMRQLAARTTARPEFAPIATAYRACVATRGFSFDDPSQILDLAKAAGPDPTFEREIALADAECRAPLYEDFTMLSAADWKQWLDQSADDIAALIAVYDELVDAARAA